LKSVRIRNAGVLSRLATGRALLATALFALQAARPLAALADAAICGPSTPTGPINSCQKQFWDGCPASFWTPNTYAFAYTQPLTAPPPGWPSSWGTTLAEACANAAPYWASTSPGLTTEFLGDSEGCKQKYGSGGSGTTRGYYVCYPAGATAVPPFEPQKIVALDPGHGLDCPLINQDSGSVGASGLREDDLTVAIALAVQQALPSSKYKVVMTKTDVQSCPSLLERGRIANNANANVFVSIHINKPSSYGNIDLGTSTLYHPARAMAAGPLADRMASTVSSSLGTNNRGSFPRDNVAVLKPTVTKMNSVLLETARLSGSDEQVLRATTTPTRTAAGVKSALDWYFGF